MTDLKTINNLLNVGGDIILVRIFNIAKVPYEY